MVNGVEILYKKNIAAYAAFVSCIPAAIFQEVRATARLRSRCITLSYSTESG